jgi:hypothetical protein
MADQITVDEALKVAAGLIKKHAPTGLEKCDVSEVGSVVFARWSCGLRGTGVRLDVRFELSDSNGSAAPVVEVGTSSTNRRVPAAVAWATLLVYVTRLAALVQAHLDSASIVFVKREELAHG